MEGDLQSLFPLVALPSVHMGISCAPPHLECDGSVLLRAVGGKGCVQPALRRLRALQHPGSIPQRPNGEELGRKQQKT